MGGKTQTTNQTSTNTPAGLQQLQDIYNRVSQVASTPYSPYTGQMTAGLTDTQNQGIAGINAAQGAASPYFNQAADYARTGAAPISEQDIQRYQSPYTQQVIDATQANFRQDNAIGQQQVIGNAAAKGALGGDRVGVAQAELARQQGLAQNPVIAGLRNQGFTQALGAAQQDRAAAAQGAYTFGALAPSVQNAQISGAQAQIGAGGLQQGTNQADLTARYNQYLQAQAFPYQQAGFLASAGMPAVAGMGGTTTGQTQSPGPSLFGQIAGLGLAGAGLASGFGGLGSMFGGGSPSTGFTGNTTNPFPGYSGATTSYMGGVSYPKFSHGGRVKGYSSGGSVNRSDRFANTVHMIRQTLRGGGIVNGPGGYADGGPVFDNDKPLRSATRSESTDHERARRQADQAARSPSWIGRAIWPEEMAYRDGKRRPHEQDMERTGGYADGGDVGFNDRFNASYDFPAPKDIDPTALQDSHFAQFGAAPESFAGAPPIPQASIPMPRPRPDDAPSGPMALPPIMTAGMGQDPDALPDDASAFARPKRSPYALPPAPAPTTPISAMPPSGAPEPAKSQFGSFNPFNLSDDARMGLMSAGLGMMASKSPFALTQIGEGGQAGVKTYGDRLNHKQQVESQARQLAQQASQFAQNLGLHRDQLAETSRRNDIGDRRADSADKRADAAERRAVVPPGYRPTADGSLEPIPGGPQDPVNIKAAAEAKRGGAGLLDDDTVSDMAGQYLSGDKSVMQNLGRGAQGAENIVRLRSEITRQAREAGLTPNQVATKMADFAGRTAAMRSLGTRGVNVEYAANTANKAIDLAEEAYAKLPRTQFVPFNKLRQLYDTNTSSPEQAAAYTATNTLVNEYARVASGGSNQATEGMRHHAREMLNTAQGPEAFNATLKMMRREIQTAKSAYNETRKEFLSDSHARDEKPDLPPAATTAPKVGDRKQFKQGWGVWDGKQYVPEKP